MQRSGYATLAAYILVGAIYIAVSVAYPELILSWVEGALVLVFAFGVIPFFYGRFRR
jgi:hypothetical protein